MIVGAKGDKMFKCLHRFAVLSFLLWGSTLFAASAPLKVPVGGSFIDAAGKTGTFLGQFSIVQFASENNQVVAKGFLSGVLTDSTGRVLGSAMRDVSIPVSVGRAAAARANVRATATIAPDATCPILHLDLGPLHLDLLGLRVDLAEVILDISAESGAGNLLGNLLCAITHLLDGPGSAADIADLLNRILAAISSVLG
jgi:hypothetical protein